ncbi:MAG: carboxypeptidase M32 [Planctomycetota bacterium]|nr:carboxypeptidase M32 [Planctomycetota bacterium]
MTSLAEHFAAARDHARQTAILAGVDALVGWDERTMMPVRAGGWRAEQAATLAAILHRQRTDPVQKERLEALADSALARDGSPEERATIRLLKHDFDKQARLPPRLVEELARVTVEAQQAWVEARATSSWPMLQPWLERIFALKREQAACQRPDLDPYDSLLDDYEPGGRWRAIAPRFTELRSEIVPLVQACAGSPVRPADGLFNGPVYPVDAQQRFVRKVAATIGFDFDRGRLDTTDHPFCTSLGPDDCRITTRWDERSLPTALFGVLHEAGHGLYDQGLRSEWYGLPPGEAASLGIHESQSRLWENLVGRSRAFWEWCFPLAKAAFPGPLHDADADQLHRALLAVRPTFIRVEADEVTYNLHIMLRFDLERAVLAEELPLVDLPAAWDDRFEADFGIRPPNAAAGVLQDIHWPAGLIGYFPTYTLGNIYAAQLMEAAEEKLGGLEGLFAAGEFGPLLTWLRTEIHAQGRMLQSEPLVQQATGRAVSAEWLAASLRRRYGPAYGL